VVILDFGLAKQTTSNSLSGDGIIGTPTHMAPEQVLEQRCTEAADWYAVGSMIYETLAGRPPFQGSLYTILLKKQSEDPAHPRTINPDADPEMSELCMQLMHRDPEQRPRGPDILARLGGNPDKSSLRQTHRHPAIRTPPQGLCGRTADYFVEVSHGLVDTALDCVVGYQRETHDDLGCLPVLLRLLDLEASPELKARVAQTFDAVYQNTLSGGSRPTVSLRELEGGESPDDSRALQLIVDEILPGLDLLGLGDASKQLCLGRVASLLKALALDAGLERDNLGLAMRAFAAALSLTVSEELHESLESDRAQLQRNFVERKEKELQVESEGSRLVIDRHGICLNDRWVTPDDFAGLRHGVLLEPETGEASHVIAWRSSAGEEFELNRTNLLPASSYEEDHYQRMLDSIYYFVVPALIERLAAEIRAGREVFLGSTRLGADGGVLPGLSTRFWRKDLPVPYSRLETVVEGGRLIVSSKDNPRQAEAHDVVGVWNAAIFSYVVEVLARE